MVIKLHKGLTDYFIISERVTFKPESKLKVLNDIIFVFRRLRHWIGNLSFQ